MKVAALISRDFFNVGFRVTSGSDDFAAIVGRSKEPLDPEVWRQLVMEEWEKGLGAISRALRRLDDMGLLEGVVKPPMVIDPAKMDYEVLHAPHGDT